MFHLVRRPKSEGEHTGDPDLFPLQLSSAHQPTSAFQNLKKLTNSAPVLKHPDPSQQFVVKMEASDSGVGAILSQLDPVSQKLHPLLISLNARLQQFGIGSRGMFDSCVVASYLSGECLLASLWNGSVGVWMGLVRFSVLFTSLYSACLSSA